MTEQLDLKTMIEADFDPAPAIRALAEAVQTLGLQVRILEDRIEALQKTPAPQPATTKKQKES